MKKQSHENLKHRLQGVAWKGYGAYQSFKGEYEYPGFTLYMDSIPKDPYAPPGTGVFRVRVAQKDADFPGDMTDSPIRKIAFRDFLARSFNKNCKTYCRGRRGTGYSGVIEITRPGQVILERSSVVIEEQYIEARFFIGLPAQGRSINVNLAQTMLFEELPGIVQHSMYAAHLDSNEIYRHIQIAEDTDALRNMLSEQGLVSFIRDGAVLPRESGISEKPLRATNVIPFCSPESLRVRFDLPNSGTVTGMGVPRGVTLVVGGGYHGKSTVLRALELGIYNHIPGDGRELCATLPDCAKIRASNGRYVEKTDISPFIKDIPYQKDTTGFSTGNASGSTSQAASIIEAMEAGAGVLLMDEDTSAANFMMRDGRMQQLVVKEKEPITSYIDRVRGLYEEKGISTVLVMGGCGDYFDVADHVIQMIEFAPHDVTQKAHDIAKNTPAQRVREGEQGFGEPKKRIPLGESISPYKQPGQLKIKVLERNKLAFGKSVIDLADVEQIVEPAQTKTIGYALSYMRKHMGDGKTMREAMDQVMEEVRLNGLDVLDRRLTGDLAWSRGLEITAALNRMRGMKII